MGCKLSYCGRIDADEHASERSGRVFDEFESRRAIRANCTWRMAAVCTLTSARRLQLAHLSAIFAPIAYLVVATLAVFNTTLSCMFLDETKGIRLEKVTLAASPTAAIVDEEHNDAANVNIPLVFFNEAKA